MLLLDTFPDQQLSFCLGTDKIRGVFSFCQSFQQNIALELYNTIILLENIGISRLDGIINPAHPFALSNNPFLTSSFVAFLSHTKPLSDSQHIPRNPPDFSQKHSFIPQIHLWDLFFWEMVIQKSNNVYILNSQIHFPNLI